MKSLLPLLTAFVISPGSASTVESALLQQSSSFSDQQIVAMGHKAFIKATAKSGGSSFEDLEVAERRFSWAQTLANEKEIKARPNSKDLDHLQILIANISKSAFVIGDYMTLDKPYDHLYIAKATSLSAIALRDVLADAPAVEKLKESDVIALLDETKKIHAEQRQLLEAYRVRKGGFSHQQLLHEYDRMSTMMKQTMGARAIQTSRQKQHILKLCRNLINLTLGKDPLPYSALGLKGR